MIKIRGKKGSWQYFSTILTYCNKHGEQKIEFVPIRVQINRTFGLKLSYLDPIRIANRTLLPASNSDPDVRCPEPVVRMSKFRMWFVDILIEILCDQIRIWFFNVQIRLSEVVLIKISIKFRQKLHINLIIQCLNLIVRLSKFVLTPNDSKIRKTWTRIPKIQTRLELKLKFRQKFFNYIKFFQIK